jgi:hypothetical protein
MAIAIIQCVATFDKHSSSLSHIIISALLSLTDLWQKTSFLVYDNLFISVLLVTFSIYSLLFISVFIVSMICVLVILLALYILWMGPHPWFFIYGVFLLHLWRLVNKNKFS